MRAAVEGVVRRPMAQVTLKLGRDKDPYAGPPGSVDEVELLVAGNSGDDEVHALKGVPQILDVVVIHDGDLASGTVLLELGVRLRHR